MKATQGDRQLGLLWAGVALAMLALSPWASRLAILLPACHFKAFFGLPCPTCGTTRAALSLARFDLLHAFTHYPLQSLIWSLFFAGAFAAGLLAWAGRPLPTLPRRVPWAAKLGLVGVVLANWAYSIASGV